MRGLGPCKLLFPNSQARCLPGSFCQWEVLKGDYKEGDRTSGCQLPSRALPHTPDPRTPASSFFQLSQHHHTRSPQRQQHPAAMPDMVLRTGAVWGASTRDPCTSQHRTCPPSSQVLVTSLLSFCSPSSKHDSCFSKLLISSPGVQEAVTNIRVTMLSPLSAF